MRVRELAIGVGLGAGLALVAVVLLRGSPGPGERNAAGGSEPGVPAAAVAELQQQVAALADRLAREESRRRELERRLAAATGAEPSPESPAPEQAEGKPGPAPAPGGPQPFVDTEVLTRAGFSASEVEELKARFEAIELERLYLRDQATREGWIGKPRFRQRVRELDARYADLRDDYGPDAYDWILFASGRPNRVVVNRVMEGSEAEGAGFRKGDVVLRYEGQRIFDVPSLQKATTGGRFGETTAVDVERDGEEIRLYPARGPLGLGLGVVSAEPDHPPF